MKVLLFEQWHGGHYATYMDCLVPTVAALCDRLVIAVAKEMRASSSARERWQNLPNVEFAEVLPDVSPRLSAVDRFAAARSLIDCLREVRPDYTLLPSADAQSTAISALNVLGSNVVKRFGPIEGTLHYGYGYAVRSAKERMKELVYRRTYANLPYTSVNFVNFTYYEYARREKLLADARIRFVGDPVPQPARIGKSAARALLGLAPDGRYLGLIGMMDKRKAVPQLLAAFRAAKLGPQDRLLLAGRLDPSFAALIDAQYADLVKEGRLHVIDRFLSTEEIEHGYEALDVATMAYFGSPVLSSLALKAVAAGTPLLADNFGWLGASVRRFDLGTVADAANVEAFAAAMRAALEHERRPSQQEAVDRLLAFHRSENFVAQMTAGLRRACGAVPAPPLEWDWVLQALPKERRTLL